jgi:myo-inositol catabolism protein IolS
MNYMTLGRNSGVRVSKIGMGIWQASGEWNGSDDQVIEAIARAKDVGITLIDTAEHYGFGHSESVLGRALKELGRDNFVVATKVYGPHLRYDELQKAARASMRRLGVDEIDLYQVHWPDPWEQIPLRETMKALEKLYLEGKIRAIGVSNFAVRDLEEARSYLSRTDIVSDQLRYNLLQRGIEEEVLPYLRKEGISVLAWSPIAQGALSGKYNSQNVPKGDVRDTNVLFSPRNLERITPLIDALATIGKKYNRSPAQVSLNWLASKPDVFPIPGAKNPTQASENVSSLDFELSKQDLNTIERASARIEIDYYPEVSDLQEVEVRRN